MQTEQFDTIKSVQIFFLSNSGNIFKRQNFILLVFTLVIFFVLAWLFSQVFLLALLLCFKPNCQGRIWAILSELQMKVMGFLKTLFTLLNTGRTERARQTCSHIKRTACLSLQYQPGDCQIAYGLVPLCYLPLVALGMESVPPGYPRQKQLFVSCAWADLVIESFKPDFQSVSSFPGDHRGREPGHRSLPFFLHLSRSSFTLSQLCNRELKFYILKMLWNFQSRNDCQKNCFFISPRTPAAPTNTEKFINLSSELFWVWFIIIWNYGILISF